MLKNSYRLLIIFFLVVVSCQVAETDSSTSPDLMQTPDALAGKSDDSYIGIRSSRGNPDMVERLFAEATGKQNELQKRLDGMQQVYRMQADSLELANEYMQNNAAYWSSVSYHIEQISDTVLKEQISKKFSDLERSYVQQLSDYQLSADVLNAKITELADYTIVLKLAVTESMMQAYQQNEQPDTKALTMLIGKYDSLIQVTKLLIEKEQ